MRKWVFRIGAVVLLIAIAACMMVIGRGHTMYFDNKKLEYEGQTCDTYRRINVFVNGEQVAKLSAKDRGMATFMGQKLSFDIEVTKEKGDDPVTYSYTVKVPYREDGIMRACPRRRTPPSSYPWSPRRIMPRRRLSSTSSAWLTLPRTRITSPDTQPKNAASQREAAFFVTIHPSSRLARIRTGEQCSPQACMASTARRYGGSRARVNGNHFSALCWRFNASEFDAGIILCYSYDVCAGVRANAKSR